MIQLPFEDIVDTLAAKTPTPGGGAAAAMTACLGSALMVMVIRFSRGKKANVGREDDLAAAEEKLEKHLALLRPMAERDCAAFDRVSTAFSLAKETEEEQRIRARAIEEGMVVAMVVPEETLCLVRDVLRDVQPVADCIGKNIVSDLGSGAHLLLAAAESASLNVRINAAYLEDREKAGAALERNDAVLGDVRRLHASLRGHVEALLG